MSFMTKMFASKLNAERRTVEQHLESQLRGLAVNIERARAALAKGAALDDNLIVNAGSISGLIARWNMITEYTPYTKDDPE